jgi:hypothetical protein
MVKREKGKKLIEKKIKERKRSIKETYMGKREKRRKA